MRAASHQIAYICRFFAAAIAKDGERSALIREPLKTLVGATGQAGFSAEI
jgi:hypothetical protein